MAHRAFHAMSGTDMRRRDGSAVWALHGFVNLVAKFVDALGPTSLLLAFDSPGGCPSRKALAPDYKAGRSKAPDELHEQLAALPDLMRACGLAVCEIPDWEADDILASAVTLAGSHGANSVVVSSDKDCHQLVDGLCSVYKPEGILYDDAGLMAKWGVPGNRWVEYAALCGEGADNLEGVSGVGPKRAAALISAFSDIEDAIADPARAETIVGKSTAHKLVDGVEMFRRNRLVGTLRRDLEIDISSVKLNRLDTAVIQDALEQAELPAAGARLARLLAA